jgi:hypothetical protein
MTPLDKVEVLYRDLVHAYGEGEDREIRAAAKLLMVALLNFKKHGGPQWMELIQEYLHILEKRPDKFERIINANRGDFQDEVMTIEIKR